MQPENSSIASAFRPFFKLIVVLLLFTIAANGLGLIVPTLTGQYIDQYQQTGQYNSSSVLATLIGIALIIGLITLAQLALANYISEKAAFDLRARISKKLATQSFHYVSTVSVPRLLTIMTSDVDSVKSLISQGVVAILSALFILIGSAIGLFSIHVRLAFITLSVIPLLAFTFFFIFGRIAKLFKVGQENLERINKIVNESIVAASLVRVLNSTQEEVFKFEQTNSASRKTGLAIINGIAALFPVINLLGNGMVLLILWYGGQSIISGELSLGSFAAFFTYANMMIVPIFIIAFMSSTLTRAFISWQRISEVLNAETKEKNGTLIKNIVGKITFDQVSLSYGDKKILKSVSFTIKPHSKNAIIGPVSAGKTQILYLIADLIKAETGQILLDREPISNYQKDHLMKAIGLVFQDSLILNTTLRENIQLTENTDPQLLEKAIKTAQLDDLIASLPQGLDTPISERGSNLSGGQKQRVMLARALALNPKILLLDDFTARVDRATEQAILHDLAQYYPAITLISITQKIAPIEHYDQIIVLMEGEVIGTGTHQELLATSLEYKQICESQKSSES
ncbi:MAG: ABC transporter ATP-binding protein [Candidatus Abawacabacteria bacterium]|nr:ABC transporter ATP-binding protein [Candidatus Abawacabacteria bacterium]